MKVESQDITFTGAVTFTNIPTVNISTFKGLAVETIVGLNILIASGKTITITNFIGGVDGQILSIIGDGTTTISNNINIITKIGSDELLISDKVYQFLYLNSKNKWYEIG